MMFSRTIKEKFTFCCYSSQTLSIYLEFLFVLRLFFVMTDPDNNKTGNNLERLCNEARETRPILGDNLKRKINNLLDHGEILNALIVRVDDVSTLSVHFHGSFR